MAVQWTPCHMADVCLVIQQQSQNLTHIRQTVTTWSASVGAFAAQTRQILGLLDRCQLLRRSVKHGVKRRNTPRGLRYLFRHHCARILGWTERLSEGNPLGFSAELNHTLRVLLWPDVPSVRCLCRYYLGTSSHLAWLATSWRHSVRAMSTQTFNSSHQ